MILPESKTVHVGSIEFPNVKWRTRIVFEYEHLTGQSYYKIGTTIESQFQLFYCAAKIGTELLGKKFDYTFEQFLEVTDDHFAETIDGFTSALYQESKVTESKKKLK